MTIKTYLQRGLDDGLIEIIETGKAEKIRYIPADHTERWADPEEKIRADFWLELIYKYEYDPALIRFEVNVPRRTPNDFADIVIYRDSGNKDPYFVFECNRADISDSEFLQSIEQACGNRASLGAPYAGAIAGLTRRLLRFDKFPPGEREKNHLTDIPKRYGKPPEWRFYKGVPGQDLSAVPREELRSAIRKCHQTLWEGGRRSPIAAFGEFCKIIFVKHKDEKNPDHKNGDPYDFQRRDGESANDLALRVNRLYEEEKAREPDVFTESINIEPQILALCVEHLEGISLDRTELDTKGVAFEEFMGGFFKGDFGQYFTPREIIAFCVELLNPAQKDLILDPACGSGGFLLYALDHIRRIADQKFPNHTTDSREGVGHYKYWHDFAEKNLFGIEINEELARVAKMNMIIHDDGHTNIVGHDALDFIVKISAKRPQIAANVFDLILTNPPFGSVIRRTEKGDNYLEQFDLRHYVKKQFSDVDLDQSNDVEGGVKRGGKALKARTSIKTEILFLERIWDFLKPGTGQTAVVLPDGILTNTSLQGVREWLLNRFQVLAVISLPSFAFSHYDAAVKTSLVFLRKLNISEKVSAETPVFMALTQNIGYDAAGKKTFNVTVEHTGVEGINGEERIERHSCDLFDYRVYYEWSLSNPKKPTWSERHKEIIPETGLLREWKNFNRNPSSYFI